MPKIETLAHLSQAAMSIYPYLTYANPYSAKENQEKNKQENTPHKIKLGGNR